MGVISYPQLGTHCAEMETMWEENKTLPDENNGPNVFCILLLMQNTYMVRDGREFMEGRRGEEINFRILVAMTT